MTTSQQLVSVSGECVCMCACAHGAAAEPAHTFYTRSQHGVEAPRDTTVLPRLKQVLCQEKKDQVDCRGKGAVPPLTTLLYAPAGTIVEFQSMQVAITVLLIV